MKVAENILKIKESWLDCLIFRIISNHFLCPCYCCYNTADKYYYENILEGSFLSRVFVKEDDGEISSFRDEEVHDKKKFEWLRLQEKKLDYLLNDPKGMAIESSKRNKWIADAELAIQEAKAEHEG